MEQLIKNKSLLCIVITCILLLFAMIWAINIFSCTGNDRIALDLIIEARENFIDPTSVQLIGGTLLDDGTLVCKLRSANGFGIPSVSQYIIYPDGMIIENTGILRINGYDNLFGDVDSLNIKKINRHLD